MSNKKVIAGVIVLALIIGGIFWLASLQKNKNETAANLPVLSVSASTQSAKPQDTVVFTLTAENHTDKVIAGYVIEANISEVTDKSTLTDAQGASYNSATNSLVWTPLDIPANQSVQKSFTVRVNPTAVDAVIRITFNNQVQVAIAKNTQVVAGATNPPPAPNDYKAPVTGVNENLFLLLALAVTLGYFGFRQYRPHLGDN